MNESRWQDRPERTFERMVAPMLSTMEASRLEAVAAYQKRLFTCGPVAVIGIGATGWATWSTPFFTGITLVVAFALGFGAWFWVTRPKKQFVDQQRQTVLDAVCAHVGDLTYSYAVGSTDFSIDVYRTAKIIPSYSTSSLEDLIKGQYRGCNFALVEAELTRKTGKSSTTVFQGLLLEISLPQAVKSPISIVRDQSGWGTLAKSISGWFVPGDPVTVPHAAFEAKYDVYSKDAAGALSIITPEFVENFLELPHVLKSDKILAAFHENMFLMSVADTPAFLDGFSADSPVTELHGSFERVVEEVRVIHRVIDQLLKNDRYAPGA